MIISIAQTKPIKGDLVANAVAHQKMIERASSYQADAIFFPELSLTGYEPELASALAISQEHKALDDFQEISNKNQLTIGLGVPTTSRSGIQISMIIFQPNKPRQTYSKQELHADELPYFVGGTKQVMLTIERMKIAPAICYESLQVNHAEKASALGAEMYVASVAKPQRAFEKAMTHYPALAKRFSMPVLMANCVGYCDNFVSVGQSAVWTKRGILAGQLDNETEGILLFDTETEEVMVEKI